MAWRTVHKPPLALKGRPGEAVQAEGKAEQREPEGNRTTTITAPLSRVWSQHWTHPPPPI
ncbi:hypothetical protein J4Q44_G00218570 [Coregonus suidteri]|uniref:Uncharacterized protein n=1 Tax=Coregonus suidteri TaxID=861788 RepID=A0AAN8QR55_9TELE